MIGEQPGALKLTDGTGGAQTDKFLTFSLQGEQYGISILSVREIIGIMAVTPIPRMPAYVKGVINLRGLVVPVVDLRSKFGMPTADYDERTCIIVAEIEAAGGVSGIGVVVDAVNDVAKIAPGDIEATPHFGTTLSTEFILGMAKTGEGVSILLDIDRVITEDKRALLNMAA